MHAEYVGIVLHEPPDSRQPRQSSTRLVSMYDTKLGHPDWEFLVASVPRVENETVTRAVHWLECPFLLLDVKRKHVIPVVLPVPGLLTELAIVHVRRDNFLVTPLMVFSLKISDKNI